jgi:hypothetical protein
MIGSGGVKVLKITKKPATDVTKLQNSVPGSPSCAIFWTIRKRQRFEKPP